MGLELVVKLCDAGEEEIARRENEGQEEEIVDRALSLSGLVPINRREEEEETGRNKKVVKVVVFPSAFLSTKSQSQKQEGRMENGRRRLKGEGSFGLWRAARPPPL